MAQKGPKDLMAKAGMIQGDIHARFIRIAFLDDENEKDSLV
ncbi:MAG: hypothetical protein ACI4O4_10350 [Candidatus Ventricola sp.]